MLATEARELRSRVVQLKREKEKALAVLNEVQFSLDRTHHLSVSFELPVRLH